MIKKSAASAEKLYERIQDVSDILFVKRVKNLLAFLPAVQDFNAFHQIQVMGYCRPAQLEMLRDIGYARFRLAGEEHQDLLSCLVRKGVQYFPGLIEIYAITHVDMFNHINI